VIQIGVFWLTELLWPNVAGLPPDIFDQILRFSLLFVALAILPHTLLLVNVRRRPFLWILVYPSALLVPDYVDSRALASPV
jgi:hypothetical protein